MKQSNHINKKKAIAELLLGSFKTEKELQRKKRDIAKAFLIPILSNADILKELSFAAKEKKPELVRLLRKRAMRTMSGIAPVAVLTKPYACPGNCAYCPTEKNVPQSYLSNEPAVMRAIRCSYDPYVQVHDRLKALVANGHNPTKIELIVIGGTWSYLPEKYKFWYIANCFKAANDFFKQQKSGKKIQEKSKLSLARDFGVPRALPVKQLKSVLQKLQKRNETAKYNIIGLTLETRPDYINEMELEEMRELGCTRVELGVQAIDDSILKLNKRGHGVKAIIDSTKLLKNRGFKVTYHIMPGLPGSNPKKDFAMFKKLFTDEKFQPDQIKFYPTVVTKGSLLYRWWKKGKYQPYKDSTLRHLIIKCKAVIPEYVRVIRLIRDIPGESIVAGNRITNLRQVMKEEGVVCRCVRCREVMDFSRESKDREIKITKYAASAGTEYFIQYYSKKTDKILGFCRLRLGSIAIVRELHVYGELTAIGASGKVQHLGLGKKLLKAAERAAKAEKHDKLFVISGVGVRGYYRKQGYRLENRYMMKKI